MSLRNRYKCCVIGDHGVGKTSIIRTLLDKPIDHLRSTIGIDFFSTTLLEHDINKVISVKSLINFMIFYV